MRLVDDHHRLDRFAEVGLAELVALADLQVRRDRKYLVPRSFIPELLASLGAGTRVLRIGELEAFRYESVYFDTNEWTSYLGAARRRSRRFKVRTRTYVDSATCMLEVKLRDASGRTVKRRLPYELDDREHLNHEGRRFVESFGETGGCADLLAPALTTTYRRTTLLLGGAAARVTLDTDLAWQDPSARRASLADLALVETKSGGAPCEVDRALWRAGHRPSTVSKYCTGLAALSPHLPANKWNRVLRQHFDWRPTR